MRGYAAGLIRGSDVCACGHFRSEHEHGRGMCRPCAVLHAPYSGCVQLHNTRFASKKLIKQWYSIFGKEMLFDQLLHAAFMAQQCQQPNPMRDLGQAVGEMDWVSELYRLKMEIKVCNQNLSA